VRRTYPSYWLDKWTRRRQTETNTELGILAMNTRILATVCALTASGTFCLAGAVTYNFNDLTDGPLAGQGGWVRDSGAVNDIAVTDGTGINITKVATGQGVISMAHRVNDAAFGSPSLTGYERIAIFQVDVQPSDSRPVCGAYFTPGLSPDPASPTILGPMFGCEENNSYGHKGFYLCEAGYTGLGSTTQYASGPEQVIYGHWYRVQLRVDFTAYDGEGSGSIYVMDLDLGQTNYTAITNLQKINLKIRSNLGTAAPPSSWNALFIRSDSGVPLDNLVVDPCGAPGSCEPLLSIRCSQVELCWFGFTNVTYQVEYKSTLTTNLWTALGAPVAGNNSTIFVSDPVYAGQPQRVYRVVTIP
jgi:hypothetical protein